MTDSEMLRMLGSRSAWWAGVAKMTSPVDVLDSIGLSWEAINVKGFPSIHRLIKTYGRVDDR